MKKFFYNLFFFFLFQNNLIASNKELVIKSKDRIIGVHKNLKRLAQGGTAVGTGINTDKNFGKLIAKEISKYTKIDFIESPNHFEAQSAQDCSVEVAGVLKALAVSLTSFDTKSKSLLLIIEFSNSEIRREDFLIFSCNLLSLSLL